MDYEAAAEIFRDALAQYGIDVDAGTLAHVDRIGDEGTSVLDLRSVYSCRNSRLTEIVLEIN